MSNKNKVKGVLKGLRYISQIFEEEEEKEMQIGFPTDVKHVAHIGWDGPATSNAAPSWIENFKEGDSGPPTNGEQQDVPKIPDPRPPDQERRCSTGSDSILKSPSRRRSDKPRGTRRHSSAGPAADSPNRTSTSESRTKQNDDNTSTGTKERRRRKTKPSSSKSKSTSTPPDLSCSDSGIASENDRSSVDDRSRQVHHAV